VGSPQGFVTPANPGSILVEATVLAQPLQNFPLSVVASDNTNNTAFLSLPLTVTVPSVSNTTPTRSTFFRTDASPTGIAYDHLRKLVFASVEILNEVVVLSAVDGHEVASIPVSFPGAIDVAADGSAVYVTNFFVGGVTRIDPDLLQVTGRFNVPSAVSGLSQPVGFLQLATLSNGKVIFLPNPGQAGFKPFYLWDPATTTFSQFGPQTATPFIELISRNADHSKVLGSGGEGFLYDVTTDTFSGPNPAFNDSAIRPDGSQIVSLNFGVSPPTLTFYDVNLTPLATFPADALIDVGARLRLFYSLDGKHLYVVPDDGIGAGLQPSREVVCVFDTTSFTLEGVVPAFSFGVTSLFGSVTNFDLDETGMLFGATSGGVGFLDLTTPTFLQEPLPSFFASVQPNRASVSQATAAQMGGAGFTQGNVAVFFGAPPSSLQSLRATNVSVPSSNLVTFNIPPGPPRPANVTLTRSDGFFEVIPDGISFGPIILSVDADSGSTTGGDSITITGYGLSGANTQVLIGGNAATITQVNGGITGQTFPTERMTVKTPSGIAGKADVTVITPNGTATIPRGFQYLNSLQVHSLLGILDAVLYDRLHRRLYVTNQNHNRVEIFDLVGGTFLTPVNVGNAPTAIALTPDSSLLAVLNRVDKTVSVIDTANLALVATHPVLTAADQTPGCFGVPINITSAAPHRILANIACNANLFGGLFHLLNLDTGSLDCTGVAGCSANGTDINFQTGLAALASSSDSTKILLATSTGGGTALPVGVLDLTANTLTAGSASDASDAAVSADGESLAANFALLDSAANLRGFTAIESYADAGSQSQHNVVGEKLNPSGSLLFYPQNSSVGIFDTHTGRLVRHIALPVTIPANSGALALDETGTKMFLTTTTGIAIAQLDSLPLSIGHVNPVVGASGATVVIRGSGFQNGATVAFGATQAATTFIDAGTLNAVVPTLAPGVFRITIKNPDGSQYGADAAYTVN
jgi:DNA-binding beta-propeller fold protein YncE